jgi:hypothetical protein
MDQEKFIEGMQETSNPLTKMEEAAKNISWKV